MQCRKHLITARRTNESDGWKKEHVQVILNMEIRLLHHTILYNEIKANLRLLTELI